MNSRRRAMSLLELTVAILLVGMMSAIAVPRFADSLRAMRCHAAARQLAAHIDYIRSVAINEGRSTSLACDNQLHSYASNGVDLPQQAGQPLLVSLHQTYGERITLTADFDSESTLSFDLEGVPHVGSSPLSTGRIVLSSGQTRVAVVIAAGTGATRIERHGVIAPVTDSVPTPTDAAPDSAGSGGPE